MLDVDDVSLDTIEREREEEERQARFVENRELAFANSLRDVIGSKQGRHVLQEIMERAGIYASSFTGEETHTTAWHEGRRHNGLEILEQIKSLTDGDSFVILMLQEALERKELFDGR